MTSTVHANPNGAPGVSSVVALAEKTSRGDNLSTPQSGIPVAEAERRLASAVVQSLGAVSGDNIARIANPFGTTYCVYGTREHDRAPFVVTVGESVAVRNMPAGAETVPTQVVSEPSATAIVSTFVAERFDRHRTGLQFELSSILDGNTAQLGEAGFTLISCAQVQPGMHLALVVPDVCRASHLAGWGELLVSVDGGPLRFVHSTFDNFVPLHDQPAVNTDTPTGVFPRLPRDKTALLQYVARVSDVVVGRLVAYTGPRGAVERILWHPVASSEGSTTFWAPDIAA